MPSAWTVIDSETLAAPASSVSFTGIDTSYRMFRITAYIVKDASAGDVQIRLNNDSGANYNNQYLQGNSTTVSAARVTGDNALKLGLSVTASQPLFIEATIAKQVSGSAAMALVVSNPKVSSNINRIDYASCWNNTSDLISRIDLIASAGNFAAGTTVVLEGV